MRLYLIHQQQTDSKHHLISARVRINIHLFSQFTEDKKHLNFLFIRVLLMIYSNIVFRRNASAPLALGVKGVFMHGVCVTYLVSH